MRAFEGDECRGGVDFVIVRKSLRVCLSEYMCTDICDGTRITAAGDALLRRAHQLADGRRRSNLNKSALCEKWQR